LTITLELPWPPSANSYKKVGGMTRTKNGKLFQRRVDTNETKAFYFQVVQIIRANGLRYTFKSGEKLQVEMLLYPPSNSHFDIDNRAKVTLDSLQRGFLIADDYDIDRLIIERKEICAPNGKVIVILQKLN
jgi:Holliday junction resolvase RusA-like endonuclease